MNTHLEKSYSLDYLCGGSFVSVHLLACMWVLILTFSFEGGVCDLIVLIPDDCFFFFFFFCFVLFLFFFHLANTS